MSLMKEEAKKSADREFADSIVADGEKLFDENADRIREKYGTLGIVAINIETGELIYGQDRASLAEGICKKYPEEKDRKKNQKT